MAYYLDLQQMTCHGYLIDMVNKVLKDESLQKKLQQTLFQRAKLDTTLGPDDYDDLIKDIMILLKYMTTLTPRESMFDGYIATCGSHFTTALCGPFQVDLYKRNDEIDYLLTYLVCSNPQSSPITALALVLWGLTLKGWPADFRQWHYQHFHDQDLTISIAEGEFDSTIQAELTYEPNSIPIEELKPEPEINEADRCQYIFVRGSRCINPILNNGQLGSQSYCIQCLCKPMIQRKLRREQNELLLQAIEHGQIESVQLALDNGADDIYPALVKANTLGHEQIFNVIINHDELKFTAFYLIARNGNLELLNKIFSSSEIPIGALGIKSPLTGLVTNEYTMAMDGSIEGEQVEALEMIFNLMNQKNIQVERCRLENKLEQCPNQKIKDLIKVKLEQDN